MNFNQTVLYIANILKYTKFNFIQKSEYTGSYDIAKIQECEVIDELLNNRFFTQYFNVLTSKQYATDVIGMWSPTYDLNYGDIVIINKSDRTPVMFIDLKAASDNKFHGCVSIKSLLHFGKGNRNHFYLLSNSTGISLMLISGDKLYNTFITSTNPTLLKSKEKKNNLPLTDDIGVNVIVRGWENKEHNVATNSCDIVYEKDFISETFYTNNPQLDILKYVK